MVFVKCSYTCCAVALRKESVDRNRCDVAVADQLDEVALRKESVDRNTRALGRGLFLTSRSP